MATLTSLCACKDKEVVYDATGVFEATEVIVPAKAQGQIMQLDVEEGNTIHAGDTIGLIDMTQLHLRKDQLAASRQANDSRMLNTASQVAAIKQQIANAQKEKRRFQELVKAEAATQKQVDDIEYQILVLKRQLAASQEQLNANNTAASRQSTSIAAQESGVAAQIADAYIVAPQGGTVLNKYVEAGEYASPGRAIIKVADIENLYLRAYVDAAMVTDLKIGQKVKVYADKGKDDRKAVEGTVSWISAESEFTPKTIQTRDERSNLVYAVKIRVKNDGTIKRGMYGDVKF